MHLKVVVVYYKLAMYVLQIYCRANILRDNNHM